MPFLEFTQYIRPYGHKHPIVIERSDTVWEKAERIKAAGFRLEAEVLRTGDVSLTVAGQNMDVGIQVVPNREEMIKAGVDRLILSLDIEQAVKRDGEAA